LVEEGNVSNSQNVPDTLKLIKEQLDEHLDAINENSNEIEGNYEFLCELDQKIEKLNSRIDELFCMMQNKNFDKKLDTFMPKYNLQPLNRAEKEIFAAIYSLNEAKEEFTYQDIAEKAKLGESVIKYYITSLITKGIPLKKHYSNGIIYVRLDDSFRDLQRRENLIKLNPALFNSLMKE
jgi:hypothetical protein